MNRFENISNTQLSAIIDEWIKNERDRKLMKRRLIDGISLERLAEENKYYDYLYGLCTEWATISL